MNYGSKLRIYGMSKTFSLPYMSGRLQPATEAWTRPDPCTMSRVGKVFLCVLCKPMSLQELQECPHFERMWLVTLIVMCCYRYAAARKRNLRLTVSHPISFHL